MTPKISRQKNTEQEAEEAEELAELEQLAQQEYIENSEHNPELRVNHVEYENYELQEERALESLESIVNLYDKKADLFKAIKKTRKKEYNSDRCSVYGAVSGAAAGFSSVVYGLYVRLGLSSGNSPFY